VADVDRARVFYVDRLSFTDEQDHRFDQTPPLRGADAAWLPVLERADGRLRGLQARLVAGVPLNVEDVDAVQASLRAHGVEVSDVSSTCGGASASSSTPAATAGRSTSRT